MLTKINELLFEDDEKHPLELDKEEHRKKEIELKEKQKQLRDRKDELEEKKNQAKQKYFEKRDKGDEKAAERLKRDTEDIKDELDTVQTKLNTVDQMLNTVGNFQNVYELRELGESEYWNRIRELDRKELVSLFAKERKNNQELMNSLSNLGATSKDTITDLKDESSRLHSTSSLEWDEEYEQNNKTQTNDVPDVFSAEYNHEKELNNEELDDLNLT